MTKNPSNVNWFGYAKTYDLLMAHNPFYQQLHQELMEQIQCWQIESDDIIIDLGAGTGNYSTEMAKLFPNAQIIHVEADRGMNAITQQKKDKWNLKNLEIINAKVQDLHFKPNSIKACICIHSLYTFPKPVNIIEHIYHWMKEEGFGIFVDPGRKVNVLNWQIAIGWRLIKRYGFKKTIDLMQQGRQISHHNREIRKAQENGTYWTHTHEEFCKAVQKPGFNITGSKYCFRKHQRYGYRP